MRMKRLFRIVVLMVAAITLWAIASEKTIFIAAALSVFTLLVIVKLIRKRRKEPVIK